MLLFILITFTLTRATSQKTSSDIVLREVTSQNTISDRFTNDI